APNSQSTFSERSCLLKSVPGEQELSQIGKDGCGAHAVRSQHTLTERQRRSINSFRISQATLLMTNYAKVDCARDRVDVRWPCFGVVKDKGLFTFRCSLLYLPALLEHHSQVIQHARAPAPVHPGGLQNA